MLSRLLKSHLAPYKRLLLTLVGLQAVQSWAARALATHNARIFDDGDLAGNSAPLREVGLLMLAVSLVQVVFNIGAVNLGSRVAMGFGRDARSSLFHRVTDFSAREVGTFGAPSLITRITNDVQQVQLLVVMVTTMAIGAPITIIAGVVFALQEDVGLSVVLAFSIPAAAIVLGVIVGRMVPGFQRMQERIDRINGILREQIAGIRVVRAFVREPEESRRFETANGELTDVSLQVGQLMASMFPMVNLIINLSSVGVLWIGADRIASGDIQVGSLIAYLTYLVQILWSVV